MNIICFIFLHCGEMKEKYKLLLWPLIIATASCHKVVESTEDIAPDQNTTTLYPVPSTTQASPHTKHDVTSWKIESAFGKAPIDSNSTDSKEQLVVEDLGKASSTSSYGNESKEFKPSPHVGFFDDLGTTSETFDSFTPVIKKPPSGFVGFPHHQPKTKDIFKNYQKFPYKIESGIFTKSKPWPQTMETRPTAAVPVKVPAGGLYQLPDPFKEKPGDEEFGLEFSDVKENAVKKRPNPWKKIMHLITALIPVGILFSALTPNVITLHSAGAGIGPDQLSSNVFRRADTASAQLPAISERCRRRLLCELHSDRNYALYARSSGASPRRIRQCHRIPCEDTEAVARTLRWFLTYHQSDPGGHT